MNRKSIAFLFALVLAAAAPAASTVTVTPSFVSQYMFRGVRLGGPSFEPTIEADFNNFAFGVWGNFPITDKVPGQSDPEIDPYGFYTIKINDSLSIIPGFTWYNYPDADKTAGYYKSTFEPSVALSCAVGGVTLTPKLYYDVVLKGPTLELTAAFATPLKEAGTELDFTATIGTFKWTDAFEDTSPAAKNWGNYWLIGVSAPFQVTKDSKLTIGFAYTEGSSNFVKIGSTPKFANTAAEGRGVVTVSYSLSF